MRAAIYARISLDKEGAGLGTERQLADCRALIAAKGWTLAGEHVDNDISAFSGKHRPAFEAMLKARDDYDTVVVWKSDRLARRGRDLQRFLDTGATLTSCTEPEFTGSTGLLMLRILSGFAEHESGVKSERVARKMRAKAENGDPHAGGARAYGFSPDGRQIVQDEAERIREAARRILAGETLSAVLSDWTAQGVPTTRGGRWSTSNLSRLLRSPRMIGQREYRGEMFPGTWPAILDRKTWDRLNAVLGQVKKPHTGRRHLLTGLLYCGRCGAPMYGGQGKGSYGCHPPLQGGCGRCSIAAHRIEPYVIKTVLPALPYLEAAPADETDDLRDQLRDAETDLAELSKDRYVNKIISPSVFMASYGPLNERIEALRRELSSPRQIHPVLDEHTAELWDSKSLSWRQAVLRRALLKVVIVPGLGSRAPVDERRVILHWRDGVPAAPR